MRKITKSDNDGGTNASTPLQNFVGSFWQTWERIIDLWILVWNLVV